MGGVSFGRHFRIGGWITKLRYTRLLRLTGKERGDLEIKDYVVLQGPQEQSNRLPPPRTLILDFTMTDKRYGRSLLNLNGQLTNTRRSDGAPEPDGTLRTVVRKKILHYFLRLLFLHAHREASALATEIPEESGQFRFLHAACLPNIKGSVGLILAKASTMRISIPLDLSSSPFIPLQRFIRSRRPTTLLAPSLVFSPLCSA